MLVYPIFFSLIALIAILYIYSKVSSKKSSAIYTFWILIWLLIIIFAFMPELSNPIAKIFGIARGLDFLIIVSIILVFYLIFKLYMKVDKMQQDLTALVREIALNNEYVVETDDEDE